MKELTKRTRFGPAPNGDKDPARVNKWISENSSIVEMERACEMGRGEFYKIRMGIDLKLSTMIRVLDGARRATGRDVKIEELFDFSTNNVVYERYVHAKKR